MQNDPTPEMQSPVILPDLIEEAKTKTGQVQTYYANLEDSVFTTDPLFKLFKR